MGQTTDKHTYILFFCRDREFFLFLFHTNLNQLISNLYENQKNKFANSSLCPYKKLFTMTSTIDLERLVIGFMLHPVYIYEYFSLNTYYYCLHSEFYTKQHTTLRMRDKKIIQKKNKKKSVFENETLRTRCGDNNEVSIHPLCIHVCLSVRLCFYGN